MILLNGLNGTLYFLALKQTNVCIYDLCRVIELFFIEKDLVGLNICKVIIIMYNGKVLERGLTVQFRRVYWSKSFSFG